MNTQDVGKDEASLSWGDDESGAASWGGFFDGLAEIAKDTLPKLLPQAVSTAGDIVKAKENTNAAKANAAAAGAQPAPAPQRRTFGDMIERDELSLLD